MRNRCSTHISARLLAIGVPVAKVATFGPYWARSQSSFITMSVARFDCERGSGSDVANGNPL